MDTESLVDAACDEIVDQTRNRNACLIFASGVQHGRHITQNLEEKYGIECGFVCGETPSAQRDHTLKRFKSGDLKYLCNVNVLTTGFDAPQIDCVALLRPTMSPGLYYQMVGRGFRLHPTKQNCLVLDYGGNVLRHGPIDALKLTARDLAGPGGCAPVKECPECRSLIACGFAACPDCGHQFPPPEKTKHEAKASEAGVLTGQVTVTQYVVQDAFYSIHVKRGAMKTRRERYVSITWLDGTNTNRNGFVWNMKGTREERQSSGGVSDRMIRYPIVSNALLKSSKAAD